MAQFLDKEKAVSALKDLIRADNQNLILISPFIQLSHDFKELLTFRDKRKRNTQIITSDKELEKTEKEFLQKLPSIELKCIKNLHTKCYVNDEKMIITSLNLLEVSMTYKKEMGILINKKDPADTALYADAFQEVDYINEMSRPINPPNFKPVIIKGNEKNQNAGKQIGFCIRSGISIPFDVYKPLSYDCYKTWNRYGDPDFPENFCHFSGEHSNGETSVNFPILKKNWKKAKATFDL
jgi:hypothetical protein